MKVKHIVIGLCAAAVIGGGIWWFTRKPKQTSNDDNNDNNESGGDDKEPEIKNPETLKNSGGDNAVSVPPTPFKDATEGNAFRAWVNKTYPDKAKSWKLDPTGSYNNQYIRKAYAELGSVYNKSISDSAKSSGDIAYAEKLAAEKKKMEDEFNKNFTNLNVVTPNAGNPDVAKKGSIWIRRGKVVNDGSFNNRLKELKINETAEFVQDTKGEDQLTWYKVKIKNTNASPNARYSPFQYGYVRSDVSVKKTIKVPKSSLV